MADKWSRGGKVAYKGEPKCAWRRHQTNDGKEIVRLIQYKNQMILQKAVLLGAEDEEEEEEEEEEEDGRMRRRVRQRRRRRSRRRRRRRRLQGQEGQVQEGS